jgi:hypothetical protein
VYNVLPTADLTATVWDLVTVTGQTDNGTQRTVTDPAATGLNKFYQIQITIP